MQTFIGWNPCTKHCRIVFRWNRRLHVFSVCLAASRLLFAPKWAMVVGSNYKFIWAVWHKPFGSIWQNIKKNTQKSDAINMIHVYTCDKLTKFNHKMTGQDYWIILDWLPKCSMYGIFTNICPKNHPNVGKYTIHGAYGLWVPRYLYVFLLTLPRKGKV